MHFSGGEAGREKETPGLPWAQLHSWVGGLVPGAFPEERAKKWGQVSGAVGEWLDVEGGHTDCTLCPTWPPTPGRLSLLQGRPPPTPQPDRRARLLPRLDSEGHVTRPGARSGWWANPPRSGPPPGQAILGHLRPGPLLDQSVEQSDSQPTSWVGGPASETRVSVLTRGGGSGEPSRRSASSAGGRGGGGVPSVHSAGVC